MSSVDPGVYKAILRVRQAYAFDLGGLLVRFYSHMMNIGTITMLTLAGYSFFLAGLVSSAIALSIFFVSPRISKLVDSRGQGLIVPLATLVTVAGLVTLLGTVALHGPEFALFVGAILMGFLPNPQALVRARWTYLIRTGRLGDAAPDLRTMFSYEGVIDDISFMFSPAVSIALATSITPIAGLLCGGVCLVVGTMLIALSKRTEPEPGWKPQDEEARELAWAEGLAVASENDAPSAAEGWAPASGSVRGVEKRGARDERNVADESALAPHHKALIRTSPMVRVLFALMMLAGAFFGIFDTTTVALAEELHDPNIASVILMVTAFISMLMGFGFGMVKLRMPLWGQLIACSVCIGLAYSTMVIINSVPTLYGVSILGSFFYAPFLIVANSACEASVPGDRLTEGITWINAGFTCGMAFGPSAGGLLIDVVGSSAGFDLGAAIAFCIPVVALASLRIIKRNVRG